MSSPTLFLIISLIPYYAYFTSDIHWWGFVLIFQLTLCFFGLFIREWRLCSFCLFILLAISNGSWFSHPKSLPEVCIEQIDHLSGVANENSLGNSGYHRFSKLTIWCKGHQIFKPFGNLPVDPQTKLKTRWLNPGSRYEFKNIKLEEVDSWTLTIQPKKNFQLFNLTSQDKYLNRSYLLVYIESKVEYYLDGFPRSIFKALALANRSEFSPKLRTALKDLGISHIFAISGMHIGIFYLWLTFFLRRFTSFPLAIIKKGNASLIIDLTSLLLIFGFLQIIGMPISAQRAIMMLAWWIIIKHLFYWQSVWFILLGVATVVLAFQPAAIGQLSFQLSFLSVAGILLILPFLPRTLTRDSYLKKTCKAVCSIFIISLWLLAYTFPIINQLTEKQSFIIPLNNVFHILFMSLVLLPIFILVLFALIFGYFSGVVFAELYLFTIVSFTCHLWKEILYGNESLNSIMQFSLGFNWNGLSMGLYWSILTFGLLLAGREFKRME
ncbi:ComEC/Rec2 family competence protein [bacterium]|nr:ComEC/Rec2 family competence protein [bacterium]